MRFLTKLKPRAENFKLARSAPEFFKGFWPHSKGKTWKNMVKTGSIPVQMSAKILAKTRKNKIPNWQISTLGGGIFTSPPVCIRDDSRLEKGTNETCTNMWQQKVNSGGAESRIWGVCGASGGFGSGNRFCGSQFGWGAALSRQKYVFYNTSYF